MKKWMKKVLIILEIWVLIFLVDFVCVKTIKRPIFMIRTSIYKDGGTKEYYGLGYKVIKCNTLSGDKKVTIGTYFMDYNCDTDGQSAIPTDADKFKNEYGTVDNNNVFVYRNIDEIINILEKGTGIVYLGFPECKWCKAYVAHLNEIAKENNVKKIYYFNILEDRQNKTEKYMKIVEILDEYLEYNEEGNKKVYVPAVIGVRSGEIVGFDDETSLDTKGLSDPNEYWTYDEIGELKINLTKMMKEVNKIVCTDCNK